MSKVSVIIPVYNVASFIEKCARTLFEQTIDDIQYIFVNDCTPDASMEILFRVIDEYPHRKSQITIINHEQNKGSAASRKTALSVVTGEYIIACDSDDWIEKSMYERMYNEAKNTDSDMIWCDYVYEFTHSQQNVSLNYSCNPVTHVKAIMTMEMPGFLFNKMFKKELFYLNIDSWTEGADMWEDLCIVIPMIHQAKKIIHLPYSFYHYRKTNANSITGNKSSEKRMKRVRDILCNIEMVTNYISSENLFSCYTPEIYLLQLSAKYDLLFGSNVTIKEWNKIFPQSNKYLKISSNLKAYQKMLFFLAVCRCSTFFYIMRLLTPKAKHLMNQMRNKDNE